MPIDLYKEQFSKFFESSDLSQKVAASVEIINKTQRIFFIGNGGSNAICSHMMEDFAKLAGFQTFSFSDASLITSLSNDFGYENAMVEWLKMHFRPGDLLFAISSSGNSKNILNAVDFAKGKRGSVITLSGFKGNNDLIDKGTVNFHIPYANYGIVECCHQVIMHIILDSLPCKN